MSCYLRHMDDLLKEAGIELTKENRKAVDEAVHRIVEVEYKHCPDAWKAVKLEMQNDRAGFIEKLRKELK
ncbi:MAG: hypothetical protein A4E32_00991 [Methanomassiliicoccales archaeon PtaU1.Bin124]|nr:MAG: hypothetical protein A4E32_00991 [Methanomassiliicoccales archaeon PtaU1.Bin124]